MKELLYSDLSSGWLYIFIKAMVSLYWGLQHVLLLCVGGSILQSRAVKIREAVIFQNAMICDFRAWRVFHKGFLPHKY